MELVLIYYSDTVKPINIRNPAAFGALMRGDIKNAMVASEPGGIERQEKEGQLSLVSSTDMPIDMDPGKEAFERFGFKFGEPIDDIFVSATLPEGWSRRPTDHSMWSEIVDGKGRLRVKVFYKAAFYDRFAHAHLVSRYVVEQVLRDRFSPDTPGLEMNSAKVVVRDGGGTDVFSSEIISVSIDDPGYYSAIDIVTKEARDWLRENYPNADDPTAYWED